MDGIARLNGLLVQHHQFLMQTYDCIDNDLKKTENAQLRTFLDYLAKHVEANLLWLEKMEAEGRYSSEGAVYWGPITATRKNTRKGGHPQLIVSGPTPDFSIVIKIDKGADDIAQIIRMYDGMSTVLARATEQQKAIGDLGIGSILPADVGASYEEEQDPARVAQLKQYNDVRDVAQELIGAVADNKQVPVRSLYDDGSFGVNEDD